MRVKQGKSSAAVVKDIRRLTHRMFARAKLK
jgi:hypothetical protein